MRPIRLGAKAPILGLALSLLAGCLGGPAEEDATTTAPTAGSQDAAMDDLLAPGASDALPPETAAVPWQMTLHLTPEGGLTEDLPAAASRAMGGSYAKCFTQPPCDFVAFQSAPMPRDVMLPPQTATARYYVQADAPVLPGPFGFAAWVGSTKGVPLFTIVEAQPLMAGETTLVEIPLLLEGAPMVVPAGESLRLYALSGSMHEASGILKLLMGGETASSLTLTMVNVTLPAAGPEAAETFTGTLAAGGFPVADPVPAEHREARHAFTLGSNATRLVVSLRQTGGAYQGADLDMDLYEGDRALAGAHTPLGQESIFLAGPALEGLHGKELTLVVKNFFGPNNAYEVVVAQS